MTKGWEEVRTAVVRLVVYSMSLEKPPAYLYDNVPDHYGTAGLGSIKLAVQIGPLIMEWNEVALVLPCQTRDWNSDKVLTAFDLATLPVEDSFFELLKEVAGVIIAWNRSYPYHELSNNSKTFCIDVLAALGIKDVFTSKITTFLVCLEKITSPEVVLKYTFEDDEEEHYIGDHATLDNLAHLKFKSPKSKRSEDYAIMKAYDKVFWTRYNDLNGKFTPEELDQSLLKHVASKCKPVTCFFGEPVSVGQRNWLKTGDSLEYTQS